MSHNIEIVIMNGIGQSLSIMNVYNSCYHFYSINISKNEHKESKIDQIFKLMKYQREIN